MTKAFFNICVFALAAAVIIGTVKYNSNKVKAGGPAAASVMPLATIARTYAPTATPSPTEDHLLWARATVMAADAAATREQGERVSNATATAWAAGQERTATWSAVGVISASLSLSQTRMASIQTEIIVRSQVMSATEEYFLSPLRVQATQTAIAAGAATEHQLGMAWSVLGWGVVLCLLAVIAVSIGLAIRYGRLIAAEIFANWKRTQDAEIRKAEALANDKEADVWLKLYPHSPKSATTERGVIDEAQNKKAWYANMWNFFRYAIDHNTFCNRDLDEEGADIISNTNWSAVSKFYAAAGVLMLAKGRTALGHGWSRDRIKSEMDAGTFPYPAGQPPILVQDRA